jgi:quinol monooxygenase YgiN
VSVIVTLRFNGDPAQMEAQAAAQPDRIHGILDQAKQHGLIAHRFYGSDGQILVIDEWPDEQSFQTFFGAAAGEIQPMMDAVGVSSEPEINFWRKLETGDDVGWGA